CPAQGRNRASRQIAAIANAGRLARELKGRRSARFDRLPGQPEAGAKIIRRFRRFTQISEYDLWELAKSADSGLGLTQLADFQTDELHEFQAGAVEQVADGLGIVPDEFLLDENIVLEPGFHLALGDSIDDVGGLAGGGGLGTGNLLFLGQGFG